MENPYQHPLSSHRKWGGEVERRIPARSDCLRCIRRDAWMNRPRKLADELAARASGAQKASALAREFAPSRRLEARQ